MDIKYLRILWLDKRIKELKEKIAKHKLQYIALIFLLSGCAAYTLQTNKPIQIENLTSSEKCRSDNPIIQAFFLNGFKEDEIASQLKEYGKNDIDGFCEWMVREAKDGEPYGWLYPYSGGRILEDKFKKIKLDYNYFKEKNEKE